MYYVYRFIDKSKRIIYVGKSKQELEQRFRGHLHLPKECYELVNKIEYIVCETETDMAIKEIYYINKFRNDVCFFNILDKADVPVSVEFTDRWKQYKGPLGTNFPKSINYRKGYTGAAKEVRYKQDGTVDHRKSHIKAGDSFYVDGLTPEEAQLVANYFVNEVNAAENYNQEQIRFRNLVMYVLSVNLPHKTSDFLKFRYRDVFDLNDLPKPIEFKIGNNPNKIIEVPLRKCVKEILSAYRQNYGLNYKQNADDFLFLSRKHQIITHRAWWGILNDAAECVGIEKNIGAESVRKTYGLNAFLRSSDKIKALFFLGELWGQDRESQVIRYLNLTDDKIDFEFYFGDSFELARIDLSEINALKTRTPYRSFSTFSFPIHVENRK